MKLYLIRHGESEENIQLTLSKDSELTSLGRQQAFKAGEALRNEGIQRLFSSAQVRALQTATIVGNSIGVDPEVIVHLTERNFCGTENGAARSDISSRFPNVSLPLEIDEEGWARHCNKESLEEMAVRMQEVALLFRQLAHAGEYDRVACIMHQGSCSMLLRSLLNVSPGSNIFFRHHNCSMSQLILNKEQGVLFKLNDISHLAGLEGQDFNFENPWEASGPDRSTGLEEQSLNKEENSI